MHTTYNIIYGNLRRTVLVLMALVMGAFGVAAQLPTDSWNVGQEQKPAGSGTQSDPYIIATAANLFWISVNVGSAGAEKAGAADKYYVQVADIDLDGKEWMPIGNSTAGGFFGHYDGRGHTISRLRVDWGTYARALTNTSGKTVGKAQSSNIAYGLFGWFGGTIENLVIDDAWIYQSMLYDKENRQNIDLRVGVLAGSVGANEGTDTEITIRNIIVRNSRITDTGSTDKRYMTSAYFVGGLIGDLHGPGYAPTVGTNKKYNISQIYCNVDIDMANVALNPDREWNSKGQQANVGGIIGRVRTMRVNLNRQLPTDVIYSGTINAPIAFVGPVFACARNNDGATTTYNGHVLSYAGDFADATKGTADNDTYFATSYYYNYKVYNYSTDAGGVRESISDDNASSHLNDNNLGTRTFAQQVSTTASKEACTPAYMAMLQGVNRGVYLPNTELRSVAEAFAPGGYAWDFAGDSRSMSRTPLANITVSHPEDMTYVARFTTDRPATTGYSIRWYIVADGTTSAYRIDDDYITASGNTSTVKLLAPTESSVLIASLFDGEEEIENVVFTDLDRGEMLVTRDLLSQGATYYVRIINHTKSGDHTISPDNFDYDFVVTNTANKALADVPLRIESTENDKVCIVRDHTLSARNMHVTVNGKPYAGVWFTASTVMMGDGGQIPATYWRYYGSDNSEANGGNITYLFRKLVPDPNNPGNNKEERVTLDDELSSRITYTYDVISSNQDRATGLAIPNVVNNHIVLQEVFFAANDTAKLWMHDPDGKSWSFSKFYIKPATDMVLRGDGCKVMPEYTINKRQYTVDRVKAGLTYLWEIEYDDASKPKETYTNDYLEELPYGEYTLTLTATDVAGFTKTASLQQTYDKYRLKVDRVGDEYVVVLETNTGMTVVSPAGASWQWYGVNGEILDDYTKYYKFDGKTTNTLAIDKSNYNYTAYCVVLTIGDRDYVGYGTARNIVYVYDEAMSKWFDDTGRGNRHFATDLAEYPDGNDVNNGRTPYTAVKTMKRAYELLLPQNGPEDNVIVIMGYVKDSEFMRKGDGFDYTADYNKCALITGTYGPISDGVLYCTGDANSQGYMALNGATIFKDITLSGYYEAVNSSGVLTKYTASTELFIYCQLHDLTIGKGVKIEDYGNYSADTYGLTNSQAPKTNIVGTFHNYDNPGLTYPSTNARKDATTITIESGNFGRIILGARNAYSNTNEGNFNKLSRNILGHPDWPHHVILNVAIKHNGDMNEYTPLITAKSNYYKYDLGLVTGGQTDGTVYGDVEVNMISGKVGRIITGNISFGRKVWYDADVDRYPSDGFFGSSVVTISGGEIGELVGGTLGRVEGNGASYVKSAQIYFYGRSILNIKGGTIKNNIYGGGSGGVIGIGDDDREGWHTIDVAIPYIQDGDLKYGDYFAAKGKMPQMLLMDGTLLPLEKSYCQVNISGGTVNGNVYGGAYGYSVQIIPESASSYAGYLFGDTDVNITGGTVKGNVYGGAAGSSLFYESLISKAYEGTRTAAYNAAYDAAKAAGKTEAESKALGNAAKNRDDVLVAASTSAAAIEEEAYRKFCAVAKVFGDTHVTLHGGIIEGNVFAGSQGVAGKHGITTAISPDGQPDKLRNFPEIASIYGNTYLVIEDVVQSDNTVRKPIINGNVFGGSEKGRITGDTHVEIKGGIIGNNIFGGSEGLDVVKSDANGNITENTTMAVIYGSTEIKITGGTYFTSEDNNDISAANRILPANRTFNIYGGGYNNCVVVGDTYVDIRKSLFTSFKNLLEGRTFAECVADETYRKFSVYGAGRGIHTDVTGNASVYINIAGGATAPSEKPVDIANNQQFFMISGGGFAGNVYGNTNVTLYGNVFARQVYGGGMYGRIEGSSTLNLYGGSYYNVYGGGLLGDIQMGSYLTLGAKAGSQMSETRAAELNRGLYVYENVYGGNDVGGIVGYTRLPNVWTDSKGDPFLVRVYDKATGEITEREFTRHASTADYGVNMKIYGGNILGSVFGAGNGNHMGYYVPNQGTSEHNEPGDITRMKYTEGPAYLYRFDAKDPATADKSLLVEADKVAYGLYEYRPRVSKVRINISGNSEHDRIKIGGSVYGGGLACTVGRFDPTRGVNDPTRFLGGGSLKINFGSHVTVNNSVYMGSRGRIIGQQTVLSDDPDEYKSTTINSDYDFHYYDEATGKYLLGFPNSLEGRQMFHAYTRLVDMESTVQLTFYKNAPEEPTYAPSTFDSEDIVWGNFYVGGARGSMTYNNNTPGQPSYEFTFPRGLTIQNHLVGGSEDGEIVYYDYQELADGSKDFSMLDYRKKLFTYHGGIVYDQTSVPTNPSLGGDVIWHQGATEEEQSVGVQKPRGENVVVRLNVDCQFDPQMASRVEDGETVYERFGGIVYGGCYHSGVTNGSVEIICTNNLLGSHFDSKKFRDYLSWSSLKHNVGRVYGGGYGTASEVRGKTRIVLKDDFRAFNVFGGGMEGNVTLGSEIRYEGGRKASIYNAIYGGGIRGNVGKETYDERFDGASAKALGTKIELVSGGVDRVYGGAFMGDVWGGTHIVASDSLATGEALGTRLLCGSIFGGNDVTGSVHKDPATGLATDIKISEKPHADKKSYTMSHQSADDANLYYGGYPLIGSVYGAGNGNMSDYIAGVTIDRKNHVYNGGKIHIATGDSVNINITDFSIQNDVRLPDVESTRISVYGGTIVNLYGGGSMCTVSEKNLVHICYADTVARAAVPTADQDEFTWGVLRLFGELQRTEVTEEVGANTRFSHQIYRVFGGNNLMDMDIQPSWNLKRGQIFSVYSGGNFGKMTYPAGLALTVESPDINIRSIYGGGRVGDIVATDPDDNLLTFDDDHYGATLNIKDGIIGDVYGGNNVAGTVYNGTNVNISGAISGNVYGSGNGNYIYYYDYDNTLSPEGMISEGYDEVYGGRYFILPKKKAYGDVYYGDSPEEKLLAINSYRPNVDKAYLNIQGTAENRVFVLGNVYCGGNSSTVHIDPNSPTGGNIKFEIGSYVALGGVFLGSNGEGLARASNIGYLAALNDIQSLKDDNTIASRPGFTDKTLLNYVDQGAYDTSIYPNLLSLYMRAAEVTALPSEFRIKEDVEQAFIGNFTVGGNRGSMLTNKCINLLFPEKLTIFGRIVGGCNDACIEYKGAEAHGGMIMPLESGSDKVYLTIKSKFRPWRMLYNPDTHKVSLVNDRTDYDGNYVPDDEADPTGTYYYSPDRCTIYGGCYTSGKTVGGIKIDLYSDVLGRYESNGWGKTETVNGVTRDLGVNRDYLMNNVALRRTVYALVGGGYGAESSVEGDIHLRLMPKEQSSAGGVSTLDAEASEFHPSISTIFGGAHNGQHTGNSTTEVRDGMVFSSIYAGSRAALKYGSSELIIGYPKYYVCNSTGIYTLQRADQYSYVAQAAASGTGEFRPANTTKTFKSHNSDDREVIKQEVRYSKGDIVAANVVAEIVGYKATPTSAAQTIEQLTDFFTEVIKTPADFSTTWDNIEINIGDNSNMDDPNAHFYGGGGIYGGGHAINESAMTFSGTYTQLAYTADNNPDHSKTSPTIGYGGNSTIIIADNYDNVTATAVGGSIRDHISIGTGHYQRAVLDPVHGDKNDHYVYDPVTKKYIHQSPGLPNANETYYKLETEGGIYGDGRRTFVENFRAVDIAGYGYASSTPEFPKLINTFQRMDLLTLRNCCLSLHGARDYATNSVDATIYSVARIDELQMHSDLTGPLTPSDANMNINVPRARNYMAFDNKVHYLGALVSNVSFDDPYHGANGTVEGTTTYKQKKKAYISAYELAADKTAEVNKEFKKRNVGTAANMIGINNGNTLTIQNVFTTDGGTNSGILSNVATDNIYYGPIVGIVEVNLMSIAPDEGGGYIYAFNHHEDGPTFLEDTGNFLYPVPIDKNENYIIDDCYPLGYYVNQDNAHDEEIHYWYVQGHKYYFNATLTAYTFNGPEIDFRLSNRDDLILLSGITPEKSNTIEIKSVHWEDHADASYKSALQQNLNDSGADSREKYQLYLTIDKNTDNSYSLAKNTETGVYTNVGNAFVARIPNGNGDEANNVHAYGTDADGNIQAYNHYSNASSDNVNSPLLGIRLHDTDDGNQTPEFFRDHLQYPENVVLNIEAKDEDDMTNNYIIRLKIVYLQGPYINGKLSVENCALPGEYIYANTQDVDVVMDESLTVTGKKWFLYPIVKADPDKEIYSWDNSETGRVDVSEYLMDNLAGDVNRLQLPARYYQDDWKLGYCVVVNGMPFPLPEPQDETNRITVHNYHRMSTVADEVRKMVNPLRNVKETVGGYKLDLDLVGGALVYIEDDLDFELFTKYVNYCNQVRKDGEGNVIYHQENGENVATLIAEVLPGYNPNGYITGFTNHRTIEGYRDNEDVPYRNVKNPSGAENIRFVLAADVTATANCMEMTEFRGILNGNGHVVHIGSGYKGNNIFDVNYGTIRELGVVSTGGEDPAGVHSAVVATNKGNVINCFYYNYRDGHLGEYNDFSGSNYASMIGANESETTADNKLTYTGRAYNCYQNTNIKNADALAGVKYCTDQTFHNGMIAYNLNQEYLKARYNSKDNDRMVHETMIDSSTDPNYLSTDYLYSYYADGEYRYAYPRSVAHPEGLRLSDNFGVPNYENNLGNEKSMHSSGEEIDQTRWFKISEKKIVKRDNRGNIIYDELGEPVMTDEGYLPIYLYDATPERNLVKHSDFIFFGQNLSGDDEHDFYPVHINDDNRVYRASGFYGSRADFGFYFNREAHALQDSLTAIDFTCHRDIIDKAAGKAVYGKEWNYYMYDKSKSRDNYAYADYPDNENTHDMTTRERNPNLMQMVYYPPMLDLPGGDDQKFVGNLESFDIHSNASIAVHDDITKNLLVYTPEVGYGETQLSPSDSERLFGEMHYTRMQQWGDPEGETNQNDIIGHHIYWVDHSNGIESHFHAWGGLFHLADEQTFNAPIEFYVAGDNNATGTTGRAWMLRAPKHYSSLNPVLDANGFSISKDAWESISLPFTCNRVFAVNSVDYREKYSRGEITHFYGSNEQRGITHHDYWLRGLVDTSKDDVDGDDVIASVDFARPGKSYTDKDGNAVKLYEITNDEGEDEQMTGDYSYRNDWFYQTYKDVAYNEHHNEYADSMTFVKYCYLTKNAPYIVAFPGPDYYEFDLSGDFYNDRLSASGCNKQEILYEFTVNKIDPNNNFKSQDLSVCIPVTDDYVSVQHTKVTGADGTVTTHHANFKYLSGDEIGGNVYVINTEPITAKVGSENVELPAGTAFINCNDFKITEILPFHTYMTVDVSKSGKMKRFIPIGARSAQLDDDEVEEPEEPETPEEEMKQDLKVWVEGGSLMISTTYDTELYIYNMLGQTVRYIKAFEGINRYDGLTPGFYIVNRTKVRIQ